MSKKGIQKESNERYTFARKGVKYELIPYIDERGYPRIKWTINGRKGIDATLISSSNKLKLPQERRITVRGEERSIFNLPQDVVDALVRQFENMGVSLTEK